MATPNFIHGVSGTFTNGATAMNVEQFDVTIEYDADDITHSGAGGDQVMLKGIRRLNGTVTLVYDSANKPYLSPQSLMAGVVGVMHFNPDNLDDFNCSCLVTSFAFSSGPKAGAVRVKANVKSTGPITIPAS